MVWDKLKKFCKENLIITILLILAVIQPVGVIAKSERMVAIGQAVGISPAPWAFTGDKDYENFAVNYNMTVFTEYNKYNFSVNSEFASHIYGPHTNKVFYYNLFSHYLNRQGNKIYEEAFDEVICGEKSFLTEMTNGEKIVGVEIVAWDKKNRWKIQHVCV